MSRNRVIYQSEALFVSEDASLSGISEHDQLQRVQSANYSFSISRQDINQYAQLGRIDSIVLEAPTVSLDFSYYLGDGFNEEALGFANSSDFSVGFASGHMTATSGKNLFILTSDEGKDVITNKSATNYSVIGLGNAYLTDYTLDASVGSIPTVSVTMEAANINGTANVSGSSQGFSGISNPAITQTSGTSLSGLITLPAATSGVGPLTALRPGDIAISFGDAASNANDGPIVDISGDADGAHIQSVSLSLAMSRSPLERLGTRFPFARTIDFPVNVTMNVSAIVNEISAANLADMIDNQNGIEITTTFKDRNQTPQAVFKLKNAKLDSESFSSSIGSNKTVDLTFSTQIGGPRDVRNNILFSGANIVTPFGTVDTPFKLLAGGLLGAGEQLIINGFPIDSTSTSLVDISTFDAGLDYFTLTASYSGDGSTTDLYFTGVVGGLISGNNGTSDPQVTGLDGSGDFTLTIWPSNKDIAGISGYVDIG